MQFQLTLSSKCTYAVTKHVVLAVPKDSWPQGKLFQDFVIVRRLLYFADDEGACGLGWR
jgi:hypothetical protein